MRQSAWRRGWNDAWRAFDAKWTVALSLVADLVGGGIGVALVNSTSKPIIFVLGAGGAALLQVVAFFALLSFYAQRAAIRQRNEAWAELDALLAPPPPLDLDLSYKTFTTDMVELPTHDAGGEQINPHFTYYGVFRLDDARITNRSDTNVSLSAVAWLFLTGLPDGYKKGFPSPRWSEHRVILGPPSHDELPLTIDIAAKTSLQGNITFVVPPTIVNRLDEGFYDAFVKEKLLDRPSAVELTDHISGQSKSFRI